MRLRIFLTGLLLCPGVVGCAHPPQSTAGAAGTFTLTTIGGTTVTVDVTTTRGHAGAG